jgi:hypothetical protein
MFGRESGHLFKIHIPQLIAIYTFKLPISYTNFFQDFSIISVLFEKIDFLTAVVCRVVYDSELQNSVLYSIAATTNVEEANENDTWKPSNFVVCALCGGCSRYGRRTVVSILIIENLSTSYVYADIAYGCTRDASASLQSV